MTDKQLEELADRLAQVAADFAYYDFNLQDPKHREKLAKDWLLPEIKKWHKPPYTKRPLKPRSISEAMDRLFSKEEYEEVCPHHVPCVVCPTPMYRKKRA